MKSKPSTSPESVFEKGAEYAALRDLTACRDAFVEGERFLYWRYATSVYDGMCGWFFLAADGAERAIKSWDHGLGADVSHWPSLFVRRADPHPLVAAAFAGDLDRVIATSAVERSPFKAAIGRLALEEAITRGDVQVSLALIERLDDSWVRSNLPLRHAVLERQVAVARALVKFGLDPDCKKETSQSALDCAVLRADPAMLEALKP